MSIKEQLYYLINEYWKKKYETGVFCDQFTLLYNRELSDAEISENEKEYLKKVNELAERYTPYEEDLEECSFFICEKEFRDKFEKLYKNS